MLRREKAAPPNKKIYRYKYKRNKSNLLLLSNCIKFRILSVKEKREAKMEYKVISINNCNNKTIHVKIALYIMMRVFLTRGHKRVREKIHL